ncbi:methyltransferase domain-containing protein [Pedobacter arcticus]|uniref:methyltransferase domain-containing protein n=1 Tax=Pedobacter arcticus TaxID=752140 RepID=UPI00031ED478|nr:methyltransferase domain-containing protein [Pedobacter arcticus]
MNKEIKRDGQQATKIFDNRSLENDYATLIPLLTKGLKVLDIGCGTGAISKGIAEIVGPGGSVIGIDHTQAFINSGTETYQSCKNLKLIHADLFSFEPEEKFDLIVSARVLQWLNNPTEALIKIKTMLKPGGAVSILDYNHSFLKWHPSPPKSMQKFYDVFLKWRADSGLDNTMANNLPKHLNGAGFKSVEVIDADETYTRGENNFKAKVGIWSMVAGASQTEDEGYISHADRILAIEEYNNWVDDDAIQMVMNLKEVRGINS